MMKEHATKQLLCYFKVNQYLKKTLCGVKAIFFSTVRSTEAKR